MIIQPRLRNWISRGIAATINLAHRGVERTSLSTVEVQQCARALSSLQQDGFVQLDSISPSTIEEIMAYLSDKDLILPNGRCVSLKQVPANARMASYSLECALNCRAIVELINHPSVLSLAERYLGCRPTLSSLAVRWSFPANSGSVDTQLFHRDPDDWRFIKFFVYLTDVDLDSGPHIFVSKSHKTAGRLRERPYPLDEIEGQYGKDSVMTIMGPAGTCFAADTYGIHRGAVPSKRPRLILQAQYSLLPVFSFHYDPIAVSPESGVDAYINRLLLAASPAP
ncbi:phytanoyl-CoA dioxygenase family protein [Roseomonas xinghualingensis]|uniref:phytanoyl-CoA dioxygenase family protein n=1 Tax=Roseomonas xinghualingensis TaxID=2986475 RepID=UPI0021F178EC|nr:phytanoyl-CoA dioxygenase family protein [Roseomonas sp. SXEYE001]MCV4210436.1 phytanoyl-CoA dioxygenase family protein [Roseomonas sp. SXEYE001]